MSRFISSRAKWAVAVLFIAVNLIFFWNDISSISARHNLPITSNTVNYVSNRIERPCQDRMKFHALGASLDSTRKLDNAAVAVIAPGATVEAIKVDEQAEEEKIFRTATGGFISTILILLTAVAFIGNGAFLVYVFWLSE